MKQVGLILIADEGDMTGFGKALWPSKRKRQTLNI